MANTNKYNYYISLINMCDTLDDADALIEEIADDETISHADYCELYNLLMGKYQRLNEGLQVDQIALVPWSNNDFIVNFGGFNMRDFIIYDADTLNIICTMHTTEAEARKYALMHIININDTLECAGLQKHKKALVKAYYIPNYNNIEFTMICDL